jgi:hypothetical protein
MAYVIRKRDPSAALQLDFGIDGIEICSGVIDFHLPVDASLGFVDIGRPSRSLHQPQFLAETQH